MSKRSRNHEESEELNIWPSFTDLMSNAFMIISFLLLLALLKSLFLQSVAESNKLNLNESENNVRELQKEIEDLNNQITELETKSQEQVNQLTAEIQILKSATPVMIIEDSGEYQFQSGSAELPEKLRQYITDELVNKIENIAQQKNIYTVEIIGHTDGQAIFSSPSNLDQNLEDVANEKKPVSTLQAGSNADLGLMRALEVVKELQEIQKTGRLEGLQFRAYSAAQLFLPSGELATINRQPDANRRRIEIRFSPLGEAETIK